jgi:acyl dehydratase
VKPLSAVAVGDELPQLRRLVTREDVVAYAEASGDRNPLHLDDAFARSVGFPGIIAHGMFTMGHMATAVTAFAGDPSKVVCISAQFRAPVFMGEEIVAGGRVVAADGETATLETWVRVDREGETAWPIKKGQAVIRR